MNLFLYFLALWYQVTVRLLEKDRDNTKLAERSHEVYAHIDGSRQEAKMARTKIHRSVIASVPRGTNADEEVRTLSSRRAR